MDADGGDVAFGESGVAERAWGYNGFVPEDEVGCKSPCSGPEGEAVAREAGGDEESGRAASDRPDDGSLVGR